MGSNKTTETTVQQSSTTPTQTAEERELNQLQLGEYKASSGQRQAVNSAGLNLAQLLLEGRQLPGALSPLTTGITDDDLDFTVNKALKDVNTQLAYSGAGSFLESGPAQKMGVETAFGSRLQAKLGNLDRLTQLLNLASGQGQATPLSYQSDLSGNLGQRLAGLRSVSTTGNQTMTQRNPFLTGGQVLQGFGTAIGSYGALRGSK